MTSGVAICDARRPDIPLIYVNPGFERITGYSAADSIGRNCRFLQGDDRDQEGLTTLRRALNEGASCKVRVRNYRKDGGMFWNELHISPVHANDKPGSGRASWCPGFVLLASVARRKQ